MSEHVCDHFEMENPLNLATINTKNGRQNPEKITICSTDKRKFFFFGSHLLEKDWIQSHECSRLQYKKREYTEFSEIL